MSTEPASQRRDGDATGAYPKASPLRVPRPSEVMPQAASRGAARPAATPVADRAPSARRQSTIAPPPPAPATSPPPAASVCLEPIVEPASSTPVEIGSEHPTIAPPAQSPALALARLPAALPAHTDASWHRVREALAAAAIEVDFGLVGDEPATPEAVARLLDQHIVADHRPDLRDARMLRERIVDLGADKRYPADALIARTQHAVDEPLRAVPQRHGVELWLGARAMLSIRRVLSHVRTFAIRPGNEQTIEPATFVRAVNRLLESGGGAHRLVPILASPRRVRFVRADPRVAALLVAAGVCAMSDARELRDFCAW